MPADAPQQSTPNPRRRRALLGWIAVTVALLAVNYWAGTRATSSPARERVPYSPFFLQQVSSGKIAEITSQGTAIQGRFTQKESVNGSKPTVDFKTEIPAFANTNALSRSLEQAHVVVNA